MANKPINPFLRETTEGKQRGKKPLPEDERHTSTPEERGDDSSDPCEMVSLSGYGLTGSGDIIKRNFFTFLQEYVSDKNDMILTRSEAIKLQKYMLGLSTGSAALLPLLCTGPRCPYSDTCVFLKELKDDTPLGKPCPIELELIKHKKMRYIDEYDIDMNSPTELSFINELVTIEIQEMRNAASLAKERDASLVSMEVIGHDKEGEEVMARRISPFLETQEKLSAMKMRIVKRMVGDRESKYKKDVATKQKSGDSAAESWSELAIEMKEVRERAASLEQKVFAGAAEQAKPVQSNQVDDA